MQYRRTNLLQICLCNSVPCGSVSFTGCRHVVLLLELPYCLNGFLSIDAVRYYMWQLLYVGNAVEIPL